MGRSEGIVGKVIDSRYVIEEQLGSDSVAELYRARHVQIDGMRVAIRILRASLAEDDVAKAAFFEVAWALGKRPAPRAAIIDAFRTHDKKYVMVFQLAAPDVAAAELIAWYDAGNLIGQVVNSIEFTRRIGSDPMSELFAGRTHEHELVAVRALRSELVGTRQAEEFRAIARRSATLPGNSRIAAPRLVDLAGGRPAIVFALGASDVTPDEVVAFYSATSGPSDPAENIVGQTLDRYVIDQHIGGDSMSELYLGRSTTRNDRCAIRMLRRQFAHDFPARNAFMQSRRDHDLANKRMTMTNICSLPDPDARVGVVVRLEASGVTADEILAYLRTDPLIGQMIADRYEVLENFGYAHEADLYLARHKAFPDKRFVLRVMRAKFLANKAAKEAFLGTARALSVARNITRFTVDDIARTDDGRPCIVFALHAPDVRAREIIDEARGHTPVTTTEKYEAPWPRREIPPNELMIGQTVMDGRFVLTEHVGSDPMADLYVAHDNFFPNARSLLRVMRLDLVEDVAMRRAFGSDTRTKRDDDHRITLNAFFELDDTRLVAEYQLLTPDLDPNGVMHWYSTDPSS